MSLEVIFLVKKQRKLEKNSIKKEVVYNFLKEKEQEDSLTNKEKKLLKNIDKYLKNISMRLKNLKKHFKKLQKYQYGMDYIMNTRKKDVF